MMLVGMKFANGATAAMLLAAGAAFAQTPPAGPAFEVASIKVAEPMTPALMMSGKMHIGQKIDKARVDYGFMSLADLIRLAYRLKSYQLTAPDWASQTRYDISAKIPDGGKEEQVPEMLQALLAERFKLTVHHETKPHSVYALVVAKGGPKMKEAPPDDPATAADVPAASSVSAGMSPPPPPPPGGFGGGGTMRMSGDMAGKGMVVSGGPMGSMKMNMGADGTMRMESSKVSMAALAEMLTRFVDQPVVDMTELKGNYQIALNMSMDTMRSMARSAGVAVPGAAPGGGDPNRPAEAASDPGSGSIFSSVQEMGLKLEPRKLPVDLVVIDHAEKSPTEN